MSSTVYLVFDIETVVDGRLLQRVRFPEQPELSPSEAVAKERERLMAATGSDFVPHTFQVPVSVAIAKVAADFALQDLVTLDRPGFRPQVITQHFWKGWQQYGMPTFVTFNGRGFDLPVMELAAYRYGLSLPAWFKSDGPPYTQPRYRFSDNHHLDLQEMLSNHGSVRMNGGLDLCATLLGKPGKMDTKGYMVQDLWEAGESERIDNYCMCDALDTYFVFLRCMVVSGRLTLDRESALVANARDVVERLAQDNGALREYLDRFTVWREVGADDSPFVPE